MATQNTLRPWSWTGVNRSGAGSAALAALIAALKFLLGKPPGGGAIMVQSASIVSGQIIKRSGNGSVTNYYRPDDDERWQLPTIQAMLANVVLVPAVLMQSRPSGFIIPFVETWNGAADILEMLADPKTRALHYSYQRGIADDSVGGYIPTRIELDDVWAPLYEAIRWPNLDEVWAAIPVVSFERMIVEDYSYKVLAEQAR